jgi:hypothetical protein
VIAVAHVPVKFYLSCFLKEWAPFIGDYFAGCADLSIIGFEGAGHLSRHPPHSAWRVERVRAQTRMFSQGRIHQRARLKTVGNI